MNCQEYRELIEDALDVSLHGEPERRVRLHLEHCEGCRRYLEMRRAEHAALFTKINESCAGLHLPDGFCNRLVASVHAKQAVRRCWWRRPMPKLALIAASLAVMAGFVFAAVVAVGELRDMEAESCDAVEEVVETDVAETAGSTACMPLRMISLTAQPQNTLTLLSSVVPSFLTNLTLLTIALFPAWKV